MKMILTITGQSFMLEQKHTGMRPKKISLIASPPRAATPPPPPSRSPRDNPWAAAASAVAGQLGPSSYHPRRSSGSSSFLARALKSIFSMCKDQAVAVRENCELLLNVHQNQDLIVAQMQVQLVPPPALTAIPDPANYEDPWALLQQAQAAA